MCPYIYILEQKVPVYFLCTAVGLLLSVLLCSHLLFQKFIFRKYMGIVLMSGIGLLVGSKLFAILSNFFFDMYCHHTFRINRLISTQAIVYYGGLLGYVGTINILCKFHKYNFKEIANVIAVVIPLFHIFGRIGCFFAGCCYGKESSSIFAIPYRTSLTEDFIYRIPVQLYEAGFEFMLFFLFLKIYKKKYKSGTENDGKLLNRYFYLYACWRFIIEFFRGDELRGVFGLISFSQIISLLIITIILIKRISYKEKRRI